MDNKPSILFNGSYLDNRNHRLPDNHLNTGIPPNCTLLSSIHNKPDALDAVKLDPAVLEAQVTVHANNNTNTYVKETLQHPFIQYKKDNKLVTSQTEVMKGYDEMVLDYEQAVLSLRPSQLAILMNYAGMLRRGRANTQKLLECAFCKNNSRSAYRYQPHKLKDDSGRVMCPVLRSCRCPQCGATGDHAHTLKFCPDNLLTDTRTHNFRI